MHASLDYTPLVSRVISDSELTQCLRQCLVIKKFRTVE
jgi:hypothetical protein